MPDRTRERDVKGRRVPWPEDAIPIEMTLQPGDYAGPWRGLWLLCAPNGDQGTLRSPPHTITEHADGSITVEPSVQFNIGAHWHGYLRAGEWSGA